MRRTLWNFDPTLASLQGHHFSYAQSLAQAAHARDWHFRSFVNTKCPEDLLSNVGGARLFQQDIHAPGSRLPVFGPLIDWLRQNRAIRKALNKLSVSQFSRDDIALFHTVTQYQVAGIVRWWRSLPSASQPHLVLLLRYSNYSLKKKRFSRRSALYRLALSALRHCPDATLTTDSVELAREYENLLRVPKVIVMPIPHLPVRTTVPPPSLGKYLNVASLGDARDEKGFCLIAAAAERLAKTNPEIKFWLQSNFSDSAGTAIVHAAKKVSGLGPTVQIFPEALDIEKYNEILKGADLILAPYDPNIYANRTSGVFSEALALGIPTIVTRGTWMERELRKLGVAKLVMNSFSTDALIQSILDFCKDRGPIVKEFQYAGEQWNRFHSASHYLQVLDDFFNP